MGKSPVSDAHRHLGVMPAYPFYGGPPVRPDIRARASVAELIADMDAEGTERALVYLTTGCPTRVAFSFNELCVEAAARMTGPRGAVGLAAGA